MKRIFAAILALCLILNAGCAATPAETTLPAETTVPVETTLPAVNEGTLQLGVYGGSATYAEGDFSMTWTFTISFAEDDSFRLTNEAGEEKGAGTWALTENCYTMTYTDDRSATFVILADGKLAVTSDLPFGKNGISPDMVGGITLTYQGEATDIPEETVDMTTGAAAEAGDYTLSPGAYTASYTKESAMAGTVTYVYTAEIGADGTFSYRVSFQMGEDTYDGSAASGTFTLDKGVFTFTDTDGSTTQGTLTANDTLLISLMASSMAKEPYEITLVPVN